MAKSFPSLQGVTWVRLDTCSSAYVSATMSSRHTSRSVACPYEYSIKDGYDTVKYMKVDCRTSEKKFQVVQS